VRRFSSLDEFAAAKGQHLGNSEWHEVPQAQINMFADATGDQQWIHVDAERAARGPFGATIAHGYLTLALLPFFMSEIVSIDGLTACINTGLDRVRFPSPVRAGSRVRAGATLRDIRDTGLGKLAYARVIVEVEGQKRPACIADTVLLYVP
jgi:acyl dehydratase